MTDITTRLRMAVGEEPPMSLGAADVIAAGRKARRRRRAAYSVAAAGTAAAVGATLMALPGSPAPSGTAAAPQFTLDTLIRNAATASQGKPIVSPPDIRIGRLTFAQITELIRTDTGAGLNAAAVYADGTSPETTRELNVIALRAAPGNPPPSLDVQVTLPGTMSTQAATCSAPIPPSKWARYQGPCSVTRLADGATLVVRSGKSPGGYAIALAVLIRPDGTAVFAEDTNQGGMAWQPTTSRSAVPNTPYAPNASLPPGASAPPKTVRLPKAPAKPGLPAQPPIISAAPPVSASTLANLVQDLAAAI